MKGKEGIRKKERGGEGGTKGKGGEAKGTGMRGKV